MIKIEYCPDIKENAIHSKRNLKHAGAQLLLNLQKCSEN